MLRFNKLADAEYGVQRFRFIKQVEGCERGLYLSSGEPTIGVGFNLRDNNIRGQVLDYFGIRSQSSGLSPEARAVEQDYHDRIDALVRQQHPASGAESLRNQVNPIMAHRAANPALQSLPRRRPSFEFDDQNDVRQLFDQVVQNYENRVDTWLPDIPLSRERIALFSLGFNTKGGSTNLLGARLKTAIRTGNRPEAWFEIRYRSNLHDEVPVAKRRFYEAYQFGLWFYPGACTPEETRQFAHVLNDQRQTIAGYESRHGMEAPASMAMARALSDFPRDPRDIPLDRRTLIFKEIISWLGFDLNTAIHETGSLENALQRLSQSLLAGTTPPSWSRFSVGAMRRRTEALPAAYDYAALHDYTDPMGRNTPVYWGDGTPSLHDESGLV
jgi:hypothetical protein